MSRALLIGNEPACALGYTYVQEATSFPHLESHFLV